MREVSCRFKLPPGTYCIVPSTFEPNEEGEFILRVFSEKANEMEYVASCAMPNLGCNTMLHKTVPFHQVAMRLGPVSCQGVALHHTEDIRCPIHATPFLHNSPDPNVVEARCDNGLVRGHAYSITRIKYCDIQTPRVSGKIPLVRIRNPWGNEAEWVGPWSDKSQEWQFIPPEEKEEMGLTFKHDGEFWMSFKDFLTNFTMLEMTNLNPDSLEDEDIIGSVQHKWEMSGFEGAWIRGSSSGGCRNFLDTFWHNPQYRITLTEVDDDDDNKCTVIVALMQKNRRSQRKLGLECLTIGFAIYYLRDPDGVPRPLDLNFFKYSASVARSPSFINMREVSCRFKLPPGTYCIVPSTFEPNEEGEFILRVFSEKANEMEKSVPASLPTTPKSTTNLSSLQKNTINMTRSPLRLKGFSMQHC
ncbi:calpain-B-like [Scylla paramamosain]|uniref:calpain-B-like n=1 Tax=Scylla paramamosain TaxID=85552 RepID=UPI003082EA1E